MPTQRYERLDPKKREKIMEAAARELAAEGYQGASLNRILAAAGISKSTAYYYFEDKADLCACVLETLWVGMVDTWDIPSLTAKTFWPTLAVVYESQFASMADEPWRWRTMRALREFMGEAIRQERFKARFERVQDRLLQLLRKGQDLLVIRRDLPDALLFGVLMAVDNAGDVWLMANGETLTREEVTAISEKMKAMIFAVAAPLK